MADTVAQAPIVVTHDSGKRFGAQVRSHRVIVDQPEHAGGTDAGPTPVEMLGVSLGSCVAFYVQQFLHTRALPYEGLRVEVDQRKGEFVVRVLLGTELSDEHMALLERVTRSCPVHHTLDTGATITVELCVPVPAAS